jgi:hypothetical protein
MGCSGPAFLGRVIWRIRRNPPGSSTLAAREAALGSGRFRFDPIGQVMRVGVAQRGASLVPASGAAGESLLRSAWRRLFDELDRRLGIRDPDSARARRVTLLVIAMTAMNLADLTLSLTYMRSVGMFEMNPLARSMIAIGGADQLVRYKLFLTILSGGILYLLRRQRFAEQAAWVSTVVLLLLTMHWGRYNARIVHEAPLDHAIVSIDSAWVYLGED